MPIPIWCWLARALRRPGQVLGGGRAQPPAQEADEDGDDRDDNQQLYERKAAADGFESGDWESHGDLQGRDDDDMRNAGS